MKKDFSNLCNNPQKISPTVYLQMLEYEIEDKTILYIRVPDSSEVHRTNGKIFDRSQDGDFDITNNFNLVSNMYIRKRNIHIEDKIFPYATMNHLRPELFELARRWACVKKSNHMWKNMTDEEIIQTAGLYREDIIAKEKGLTLAAILLFGKDETIMSCLSHFKTDAIYRNENMDRYDDRDVIITNLLDSYSRLMEFVQKHTNDKFYLEDTHCVSIRDKIAREICCNLLIHRELTDGTTSRIIITKDKIYTENPNRARTKGFITINNCVPYSKNPKIAKVFRELGLADELGSGVRNTTKYTQIYSGEKPIFEEDDMFRVTIPLERITKAQDTTQDKTPDKTPDKAPDKAPDDILDRKVIIKITEFCEEAKTAIEIMEYCKYKNIKRFRRDYITPLVREGKLKMTIPDKPTSRNQKYIKNEEEDIKE